MAEEMAGVGGDHRLWVNLSSLGQGDIFTVLPQLMKNMLSEDVAETDEGFIDVVLPSNEAWQTKIYYKLVERQRLAHGTPREKSRNMLDPLMREDALPILHDWNILTRPKLLSCDSRSDNAEKKPSIIRGLAPITWTVSDIAKAGCLLSSPPLHATFEDEQEMRRVYTLIYDVFRYKTILNQALNDVSFFQVFPKLTSSAPLVWLLLYDLYHRSFMKRDTRFATLAMTLFESVNMTYVENALWTQKVKLAATVSRLRIKHNALSLSDLLPPHLKDERAVTMQSFGNPLTCWVNPVKAKDLAKLTKSIEKHMGVKVIYDIEPLDRNSYKWDRHCPDMVTFHPTLRTRLARSRYIRDHMLIVQDRSFCLGPATFSKLITNLGLTGTVIQSHVNSPRTTAYLATLMARNEKIHTVMVFSAGKRKGEYENYFKELGITNIQVFMERLTDAPPDAPYMEDVVAVFATPPNSYTAVSDPIDLVCSRGGDLSMLEVLTETNDTKEARDRINNILEEQKKTLKFAMSKPQIQFVLYETHSELDAENSFMVNKSMREINKIAKLQHAAMQGILPSGKDAHTETDEINNNENEKVVKEVKPTQSSIVFSNVMQLCDENINCDDELLEDVIIPETDVFDMPDLPTLCNCDVCRHCEKEGCYLALLKRKKVIHLDDKYMIKMAENRGLFGSNTSAGTRKSKSGRGSKKKKQDNSPEKILRSSKRKLKEEEDVSCKVQGVRHKETRDPNEPPPETKDACITAAPPAPRNILGNLTSAHIRQFVSPFYKQKETPEGETQTVPEQIDEIYLTQAIDETMNAITEHLTGNGETMNQTGLQQSNEQRVEETSGDKVTETPSKISKKRKRGKVQKVLARITIPTQNCLIRMMKEEKEPMRPKKTALEYTKRTFICNHCRKRNLD